MFYFCVSHFNYPGTTFVYSHLLNQSIIAHSVSHMHKSVRTHNLGSILRPRPLHWALALRVIKGLQVEFRGLPLAGISTLIYLD